MQNSFDLLCRHADRHLVVNDNTVLVLYANLIMSTVFVWTAPSFSKNPNESFRTRANQNVGLSKMSAVRWMGVPLVNERRSCDAGRATNCAPKPEQIFFTVPQQWR
jgi:hypothetical protein